MNTLAVILGSILGRLFDPVSAVVALVVVTFSRKKWIIIVAAIIAAIVAETVLTSMQMRRSWGQGLVPGIIAGSLHAIIFFWVVGRFRKSRDQN